MNVNLTLIVQGLLFILTYYLLRILLFRPLVTVIKKSEDELKNIQSTLAHTSSLIEEAHIQNKKKWLQFRNYCFINKPVLNTDLYQQVSISSFQEEKLVFSAPEVQKLIESLEEKIINRIRKKYD